MKTDRDKELLDRIKTREELEKRGFKRKPCSTCNGIGILRTGQKCHYCDGHGYTWDSPTQ